MSTTNKEKLLNTAAQPAQPVTAAQTAQPVQVQQIQQPAAVNANAGTAKASAMGDMSSAQTANNAAAPNTNNATDDINSLMTMSGLSDATKQTLGQLVNNGYQPSATVSGALNELNSVIGKQPAAFQSAYMQQLNNVMQNILGRQAFSYDMASDPMFQQYKSQYVQAGKNAMKDTMGQAAALTGGYGNSYAQTAGQQAYDAYLQQLGDRMPELYGMALDAYNTEGDLLATNYGLLSDAYNREYGEYQDMYNRWLNERDYAADRYYDERNFDYGQYSDALNAQMANRDYYYNMVVDMVNNDETPSDELLRLAGFTDEDIASFKGSKSSGSSSGSSGKSTSGSAGSSAGAGGSTAEKLNSYGQSLSGGIKSTGNTTAQYIKDLKKKKITIPKNLYVTDYLGMR